MTNNPARPCVALAPLGKQHLAATYRYLQDPQLAADFLLRRVISWTDHSNWFDGLENDPTQRVFAIEVGPNHEHVGNCGLKHLEAKADVAELWIYIGQRSFRRQGIATRSLRLLIDYARKKFGLTSLCLHVASENHPAIRLYKSMGFVCVDLPMRSEWASKNKAVIRMRRKFEN